MIPTDMILYCLPQNLRGLLSLGGNFISFNSTDVRAVALVGLGIIWHILMGIRGKFKQIADLFLTRNGASGLWSNKIKK